MTGRHAHFLFGLPVRLCHSDCICLKPRNVIRSTHGSMSALRPRWTFPTGPDQYSLNLRRPLNRYQKLEHDIFVARYNVATTHTLEAQVGVSLLLSPGLVFTATSWSRLTEEFSGVLGICAIAASFAKLLFQSRPLALRAYQHPSISKPATGLRNNLTSSTLSAFASSRTTAYFLDSPVSANRGNFSGTSRFTSMPVTNDHYPRRQKPAMCNRNSLNPLIRRSTTAIEH